MTRQRRDPTGSRADKYLGIDHLEADLVGRSVRGSVATIGLQAAKVVAQAGAIVVLARLLAPEDFGRFAMVAAFLSALELFKDLGLSTATVQRREITSRQIDTLFWLNTALGATAAAIMAALAPLLAWIYGQPILLSMTPVLALGFLFTGLAAQHLALLRRQMRFVLLASVQMGAEIAGLAAAVAAAFAGAGIWSLVIQRLVWAGVIAVAAWVACGWRPGRPGPFAEVRGFVAFGGNATASMLVSYLAANLDTVLLGWRYGATPLGLYERSQKLLLLPIRNLNMPLGTVVVAALSRLDDQPERYRRFYLTAVERLAMLFAPLGALLAAASGPVIALVLGPQWSGAAPILAWMGATTVYVPATYALSWLYLSQDRTPEMLRAGMIGALMAVAAIVAGLPWGPVGVAASIAISGIVVRAPVLFHLAGRRGPVPTRAFYAILATPAAAAMASALAIQLVRRTLPADALPLPALVAALGAVAVLAAILVYLAIPRGRVALRGLIALPRLMRGGPGASAARAQP